MPIRVGVIGAGSLGLAHLESLAAFPDVETVAVCDQDRHLAEEAAEVFDANAHINFRNVIENERLDAVFVCLPPIGLGEPEILAARAGIHVFVERPVALRVERAREVAREIEQSGVIASVGYRWRYLTGADRLKEMLAGRKVALVWAWHFLDIPQVGWRRRREASGGLFHQAAADLIDAARYLVGEVRSVGAMQFEGIAAPDRSEYDIEDASAALLGFRDGAIGQIVCTDVAPGEEGMALSIVAEDLQAELNLHRLELVEPGRQTQIDHEGCALHSAHEAFLEAVRRGKPDTVRSTYADAVTSLEVSLAVRESIETGKLINL